MEIELTKSELDKLLPHTGSMSLLSRVTSWDKKNIICETSTHTDQNNPLRFNGRLHTVCGVEYAAQSMAIHNALIVSELQLSGNGYLAILSKVQVFENYLDNLPGIMEVQATRVEVNAQCCDYAFILKTISGIVLEGKALVVIAE